MRAAISPSALAGEGRRPGAYTYPLPHLFRPTQAVCGGRFFADRAEARLETSRRAYSGLDPLHHKGRGIGRGPETGTIRRLEAAVPVVVGPMWETRRVMSRRNRPETRNPAIGEGGVSVSLRSSSCKVDGSGRKSAECKRKFTRSPRRSATVRQRGSFAASFRTATSSDKTTRDWRAPHCGGPGPGAAISRCAGSFLPIHSPLSEALLVARHFDDGAIPPAP